MISTREVLIATSTRFLPLVAAMMTASLVVEPLLRHHSVVDSLRAVYLPLAVAEPFLLSIGFAAGLWTVRNRLTSATLFSIRRHFLGSVVAFFALVAASIFSQGAHLPLIVSLCVAIGMLSALASFSWDSIAMAGPTSSASPPFP